MLRELDRGRPNRVRELDTDIGRWALITVHEQSVESRNKAAVSSVGLSTWESNRKIQRVRSDEKRKVAWFFGKCKEIAAGRPSGIENHGSINQPRYIAAVTVYISHCFPKCSKHGTSAAHVLRLSSLPWWRLTANTWWLILLIHYSCLLRLGFVPGFFFSLPYL